MERYRQEHQIDLQWELQCRLRDFDPKQGGNYYNRYHYVDLRKFDLDEESPLGPMRFTNAVYKDKDDYELCAGINIYSVKIACSDVGFPIHVYGTVIARDSIDLKCVYLFRRDRDHCQILNSEDDPFVLTGPKLGLAKIDDVHVETDLKIRDHQGQDRELSKGVLKLGYIGTLTKLKVEIVSLATRLSTLDVLYGYVEDAVEGTIVIEVIQGYFDGQITAHTTSTPNRLVLYDRELYGASTGDVKGAIQLTRPIVCVSLKDMLVIVAKTRDGMPEGTITFSPRINGGDEDDIVAGDVKMRVKVNWSIMDL
ncbi:hypothetical protein EJB05_34432, partial [Eragrostis curvula]